MYTNSVDTRGPTAHGPKTIHSQQSSKSTAPSACSFVSNSGQLQHAMALESRYLSRERRGWGTLCKLALIQGLPPLVSCD